MSRVKWLKYMAAGALIGVIGLASAETAATKVKVPALVLTAKADGFDRKAVAVSDHQFFLIVRNATGIGELAYHIVPATGAALSDFLLHSNNPRSAALMNLSTGTYTITEANHPAWVCTLTVK